jgi:hypothetical protein
MRLRVVADIHEDADARRDVLAAFEAPAVDRVVHLGDVADLGRDLDATCAVLAERGIAGVWGTQDLGLTAAADAEVTAAMPVTPATRAAMRTLEPSMRWPVPAQRATSGRRASPSCRPVGGSVRRPGHVDRRAAAAR